MVTIAELIWTSLDAPQAVGELQVLLRCLVRAEDLDADPAVFRTCRPFALPLPPGKGDRP
jgi:hypothetical protein